MLETLLEDNLKQRRDEVKKVGCAPWHGDVSGHVLRVSPQTLESISVADRDQQLVMARAEYQHVSSSYEHTKQQFDGDGPCAVLSTPLCL